MYQNERKEGGTNKGRSDEEAWVGRNEVKNKMARKLGKARIGRNRKKAQRTHSLRLTIWTHEDKFRK